MTRKQLDSFAHRVMLAGVDLSRFTFGARRRMAFGFSQPAVDGWCRIVAAKQRASLMASWLTGRAAGP
jgi:hypothetical protein